MNGLSHELAKKYCGPHRYSYADLLQTEFCSLVFHKVRRTHAPQAAFMPPFTRLTCKASAKFEIDIGEGSILAFGVRAVFGIGLSRLADSLGPREYCRGCTDKVLMSEFGSS